MQRSLPTWIRVPALGGHAQLVLALILGLWMCWIVWPVSAREHWNLVRYGQERTASGTVVDDTGASIAYDGTVILKTSNGVRQVGPIGGWNAAVSPDQRMFAVRPESSSGEGPVRLYHTADGSLRAELIGPPGKRVLWFIWSPDSRMLAVRYVEPEHYLFWERETGRQIAPPFPQPAMVLGMVYADHGQIVLLSTPDTLIALRTRDGQEIYRSPIPASKLVLAPDESVLLAYEQGHIRAMRTSDGVLLWTLGIENTDGRHSLPFADVSAVAVSPDSQYLVVGEQTQANFYLNFPRAGKIVLIQMADGTIVRRYQGQANGIGLIGFTPNGQTFLSSNSSEIAHWDVAPLPPWLIWLPGAGLAMLLLHALWQWNRRRGQQIRGHA
jgi:WD40 repeat protein